VRLIDLSQPVFDAAPNCPDHPPVSVRRIADHAADGWRMELLTVASHTGSHVDAPLHRLADGQSIDDLPLETWVGGAFIADLRGAEPDRPIGPASLERALAGRELHDAIVLLATGLGDVREASDHWLHHPAYVSPQGAAWLVQQRIRGLGIDHYSIGGVGAINERTHEILLGAGVWIVEELRIPPEVFALPQPLEFWSLPVNLRSASGAFCRPVIVADSQEGEDTRCKR